MAARVRLSSRDLSVRPGSEVAVDCFLTNTGRVVDEFHVRVLGDAARWAETGPPIRLMPGQEGMTRVVFRPPRGPTTGVEAIVVTPITMAAGQSFQLVCQPASGTTPCGGSVCYTGFMKAPPPT